MRVLTGILRELAGLFVDDGWLAIAILGVVALAAVVAALTPAGSLAAGVVLVCGRLAVLFINVRAAQRAEPRRALAPLPRGEIRQ